MKLIKQKLLELLELCLKARSYGVDCFYDYSPHVDWVHIRIYSNGWGYNNHTPDKEFVIYTAGDLHEVDWKTKAEEGLEECTKYIIKQIARIVK